jgi:hypothetical protein
MVISDKTKREKRQKKEFDVFRKKMGANIIWFDSLPEKKKWDLFFGWKKEKFKNKLLKPEWVTINRRVLADPTKPYGKRKIVKEKVLKYPPSLKHFILEARNSPLFRPLVTKVRQNTIDMLLGDEIESKRL